MEVARASYYDTTSLPRLILDNKTHADKLSGPDAGRKSLPDQGLAPKPDVCVLHARPHSSTISPHAEFLALQFTKP